MIFPFASVPSRLADKTFSSVISPATSSLVAGEVVDMPILPVEIEVPSLVNPVP